MNALVKFATPLVGFFKLPRNWRFLRAAKNFSCILKRMALRESLGDRRNTFAIKAEISDPQAETFAFRKQKTMYGGKYIAEGDRIFVFASENEGGCQV